MQISKIFYGPVKKEFKAPYVASALVFKDVVGFCFGDFCNQVLAKYQRSRAISLTPEFIFSKVIVYRFKKSQTACSRKKSLDLMLYMNAPQRPWFINDFDPVHLAMFEAMGIDMASQAYQAQREIIQPCFDHPYAALVFGVYSEKDVDAGLLGNFDACNLAKALKMVIKNHPEYKHAKTWKYFDHDAFFMQWLEVLDYSLGGHLMPGHKTALSGLIVMLNDVVNEKSKLMLYKTYTAFANPCDSIRLAAFFNAVNYSKIEDYDLAYCIEVLTFAKDRTNWGLFGYFYNNHCSVEVRKNPVVKRLVKIAESKITHATSIPDEALLGDTKLSQSNYQKEIQSGLNFSNVVANAFTANEPQVYSRTTHAFSPHYSYGVGVGALSTDLIVDLLTFLYAVLKQKKSQKTSIVLSPELLKGIYPDQNYAWNMISVLITAHVLKLDADFFESIGVSKLNCMKTYMGAEVQLNINEIFSIDHFSLQSIFSELKRRRDLSKMVVKIWSRLVESYFYAEVDRCVALSQCDALKNYEIPMHIKESLRKSELSAQVVCQVVEKAFESTKASIESSDDVVRVMGIKGLKDKPLLTYNLNRYLESAMVREMDDASMSAESHQSNAVLKILSALTGLPEEIIYSAQPHNIKLVVGA